MHESSPHHEPPPPAPVPSHDVGPPVDRARAGHGLIDGPSPEGLPFALDAHARP